MSDSDQSGHWQFLVNILGAKPKEEPAAEGAKSSELPAAEEPSKEETMGSGPSGRSSGPAKPEKRSRKTGESIREKLTHWSNVLRSVGVEPSPTDFELPAEEVAPAEKPRIEESIPSPFAQGATESPTAAPGEQPSAEFDPLEAWPSKPARSAPSGRQDRGREPRGAGAERQRDVGRDRQRDREREGEHKRDRERDVQRDREKERERSESGERTSERRGERRRRRRSESGSAYDERSESRPIEEPIESLLNEELADLELEPTESTAEDDEVRGPSDALESERRGRRRRRGRRGRRDREGSAEAGTEQDRARTRTDEDDDDDQPVDEPAARIETPFETVEVEFEEGEYEKRPSDQPREAREGREERGDRDRTGRRRRRRSRSGRDDDAAQSRRAAEISPEDRLDDEEDEVELVVRDEFEANEPLVDDLISSDLDEDEEDEDDDRLPVRPVRSSVPSWEEAISDIIARNMAGRHKTGGGGGHSGGGRRGRGRGGRRNGPRERH